MFTIKKRATKKCVTKNCRVKGCWRKNVDENSSDENQSGHARVSVGYYGAARGCWRRSKISRSYTRKKNSCRGYMSLRSTVLVCVSLRGIIDSDLCAYFLAGKLLIAVSWVAWAAGKAIKYLLPPFNGYHGNALRQLPATFHSIRARCRR